MTDSIEFYGYVRTTRSIKRADVVLFLIDATLPVSGVDKKLAGLIHEQDKSCILVINKWDLAKDQAETGDYEDYLTKILPGLRFAPRVDNQKGCNLIGMTQVLIMFIVTGSDRGNRH